MNLLFLRFYTLIILAAFVTACTGGTPSTPEIPPLASPQPTDYPSPTFELTSTPEPTSTPAPTLTPSLTPTPQPPGQLLERLGKGIFRFFAYSPDGQTFAVLTDLGVYRYDIPSLNERTFVPLQDITRIFYRSDGQLLASSWQSGKSPEEGSILKFWKVNETGMEPLSQFEGPAWSSGAYPYQVSPDGKLVAIHDGKNNLLEVWQISDASRLATWDVPVSDKPGTSGAHDPDFVFSPDSSQLAFCDGYSYGGNITVLSITVQGLTPIFRLSLVGHVPNYANYNYWPGLGNYGIGLAISPDGKQLVTGGPDNQARVWDMSNGKLVASLKGQNSKGLHVAYSPDGQIVTVVNNEALYIYTTRDWKLLGGQYDAVNPHLLTLGGGEVIFSPDGSQAATSYRDKIYFTNLKLGFRGSTLTGFGGPFGEMAVSRDGSTLAVAGQEIHLIDFNTRETKGRIDASNGGINRMAFSPDGLYLAATMNYMGEGCDGWAQIWRVENAAGVQKLDLTPIQDQYACVGDLAYSPDGSTLAIQVSIESESFVELWQVNADGTVTYLDQEDVLIPGTDWLGFSPDGRSLVSYSGDNGSYQFQRGIVGWNLDTHTDDFTPTDKLHAMQVVDAGSAGWLKSLRWVAAVVDDSDQFLLVRGGLTKSAPPLQSIPAVKYKHFVISPNLEWVIMIGNVNYKYNAWLWNLKDGRLLGFIPDTGNAIFSPDGSLMATIESSGTIAFWKLK